MSSKPDEAFGTGENSSPGSRLQKAREALGISQKSLADDLYLPRNYILWIEEGSFDKLPSMVFCRGYIRSYAKAVNENGEELIELLDSVYGNHHIRTPLMSVSKIEEQVKVGDPIMKWSSLVFVLVLCALVFWWWQKQYGLTAPVLSNTTPVAVETVNGNELVLPLINDQTEQGVPTESLPSAGDEQAPDKAEIVEPAVAEQETPTTEQANISQQIPVQRSRADSDVILNATNNIELSLNIDESSNNQFTELEKIVKALEPDTVATHASLLPLVATSQEVLGLSKLLQIEFNNECWVTIKDRAGKTLFNGIKRSNQRLSLSGEAPLNVSIGRVDSVSNLTYGGTKIDLGMLDRNNIANFLLPL